MATNIYYIPKDKGILITSDFADIQKRMDIGMDPIIEYIQIAISDFDKYLVRGFGFDKIDNDYFQNIKEEISRYHFKTIAFHESTIDLSDVILDVEHLIVGNRSKINLAAGNFKNIKEITFLERKNFMGKILGNFNSVMKIV